MNKLIFLLLISPVLGLAQVKTQPIAEFSQDSLEEAVLVDVRTPEEFDAGHLDNAININWLDTGFITQFEAIPKSKPVYVYCKKGGRSAQAAAVLDSLGYSVTDLSGGYDALQEQP